MLGVFFWRQTLELHTKHGSVQVKWTEVYRVLDLKWPEGTLL